MTTSQTISGLLETALEWMQVEKAVAMATVISTWGSSPRPVGSFLVVNSDGDFVGSVSGGCVEAGVIEACGETLLTDRPQLIKFSVSQETAWDVGLTCGGSLEVFVNPCVDIGILRLLLTALPKRECWVLATNLNNGVQELLNLSNRTITSNQQNKLNADACVLQKSDNLHRFLQPFLSRPRLVIIGAVHIAEYLVLMATLAEYEVWLIEPRSRFADRESFSQARHISEWPDKALKQLGLNNRVAVVTLSHDPKLDDPALLMALRSPAFYVAALGSRRTQKKRQERLRQAGLKDFELQRLHGPAGLDIGAKSPMEIAVSIMADLIREKHGKSL